MSVDLPKFMRTTPLGTLKKYVQSLDAKAFEDLDWKASRHALTADLLEAVDRIAPTLREKLLCDVDRIRQFEGDAARNILRGVLPNEPDGLREFDALEDVSACALHVLMLGDEIFENALAAVFAQRLLNGRDWTGLDFEPGSDLEMAPSGSLAAFAEKLRDIFDDRPTPRVVVERFSRRDADPAGTGGTLVREQFTIYVEGPPEAMLAFTGTNVLQPRTVRRVHEAAILFDAQERLLDVVAQGGGKMRRKRIADAFVNLMLAPGANLSPRSRRMLALDLLKRRPQFHCRVEDRVKRVDVARLVMGAPDHGAIAVFEVPARSSRQTTEDLYTRAERAFGPNGLPGRVGWTVRAAKLRVTFEPETKTARAKTVTFEMKAPDRTNLRDQIEVHRRIADTLLERWGLYAGLSTAESRTSALSEKQPNRKPLGPSKVHETNATRPDFD